MECIDELVGCGQSLERWEADSVSARVVGCETYMVEVGIQVAGHCRLGSRGGRWTVSVRVGHRQLAVAGR